MKTKIIIGLLAVILLVGGLSITKIVRAQPICLNPAGHLVWSGSWSGGNVPVASTTRDILSPSNLWHSAGKWVVGDLGGESFTNAIFDVRGVMRLKPTMPPTSISEGMIYYDSRTTERKFKCAVYDQSNGSVVWKDCVGGGGLPQTNEIPFVIQDEDGNIVLEINQEFQQQ